MKKNIKLLSFIAAIFTLSTALLSANTVNELKFTATTITEKVIIKIDGEKKTMDYLTPNKTFNYVILDYDYNANADEKTYLFKATLLDTLLNTASEAYIYSNGTFTEMRIGRRQITFRYVDEFTVK